MFCMTCLNVPLAAVAQITECHTSLVLGAWAWLAQRYHFGFNMLAGIPTNKSLTGSAAKQWQYLNTTAVKSLLRAEEKQAGPRTVDI